MMKLVRKSTENKRLARIAALAAGILAMLAIPLLVFAHPDGSNLIVTNTGKVGPNTVSGQRSMAIGANNNVASVDSLAVGNFNSNWGYGFQSCAVGNVNTVVGSSSMAIGTLCTTYYAAQRSLAAGYATIAAGADQVAIGKYNVGSTTAYFVVGNGANDNSRSNLFVIEKNGDVIVTKPQGDISMGQFGPQL